MLDQTYYKKTDEIIEHYGRKAASLIPIMQDILAEYRYLRVNFIIYSQCRCKSAGTKTGNCLNGKHHIICSMLLMTQSKFLQHCFLYRHGLTYMTGSTVTYLDDVLALRLKGKVFIESSYTVRLRFFYTNLFRNISKKLSRKI